MEFEIPLALAMLISVAIYWIWFFSPALYLFEYIDKKLSADMQMRIGPKESGSFGFLQHLANRIKWFTKEDLVSGGLGTSWGPVLSVFCLFVAMSALPTSEEWVVSNVDNSLLLVVLGLFFTRYFLYWAAFSTKEISEISSFRLLGQNAYYLLPVFLSVSAAAIVCGTDNLVEIVRFQGGMPWNWIVLHNPGTFVSAIGLFWSIHLWISRAPFDFTENAVDREHGYKQAYSSHWLGVFHFIEYGALYLGMALIVVLYLGAGRTPFSLEYFGRASSIIQFLIFFLKTLALTLLSIWLRWSLPQLKADQIFKFSWKFLVPLNLAGLMMSALWMSWHMGKGFWWFHG